MRSATDECDDVAVTKVFIAPDEFWQAYEESKLAGVNEPVGVLKLQVCLFDTHAATSAMYIKE